MNVFFMQTILLEKISKCIVGIQWFCMVKLHVDMETEPSIVLKPSELLPEDANNVLVLG